MNKRQKMPPKLAKALELRRAGEDWAGALVEAQCLQALDGGNVAAETSLLLCDAARHAGSVAEKMCARFMFSRTGASVSGAQVEEFLEAGASSWLDFYYAPVIPYAVKNPVAFIVGLNDREGFGVILSAEELCDHIDYERSEIVRGGSRMKVSHIWLAVEMLLGASADKEQYQDALTLLCRRIALDERGDQFCARLEKRCPRDSGLIPAAVALIGVTGQMSCGAITASILPAPIVLPDFASDVAAGAA
jgi:hypothetical protein